ncbi:MAG: hypothetical protein ACE5HA_00100 [Anaerolineae bacterium]
MTTHSGTAKLDLEAIGRRFWQDRVAELWQRFVIEMDVACLHPSVTEGMSDEELQAYIRMWT